MKLIITLFTFCLFSFWGHAQLFDVFQNKAYETSMRVVDTEIDKAYVPSDFSIDIDKNKKEQKSWSKIEDQLYTIAKKELENDISYYKIESEAIAYKSKIENWNRRYEETEMYLSDPALSGTEVELVSVLNNCGIYTISYIFEMKSRGYGGVQRCSIKRYYFADYKKNKVTLIEKTPTQRQQEKLKEITLAKFKRLYLLQTLKLDVNLLDSIGEIKAKDEVDFASTIDYAEAIVYPYFSGIIVEFPKFSNSSHTFIGYPFRVFLRNEDVQELLSVYPQLKPAFKNPLKTPSKTQLNQLNNDDNFNLTRFQYAPKEAEMLDVIDFDKKVYALKINTYVKRDTAQTFRGSKKIYFNKYQAIQLIERYDKRGKIYFEEKYVYTKDHQLQVIKKTISGLERKIYRYKNNVLNHIENIELMSTQDYSSEDINMQITQIHFVYSNNRRYTERIALLGEFDKKYYHPMRSLEDNKFCTNSFCILLDKNQHVIGVQKKSGAPLDLLTNENNQPVEAYVDNDRKKYFFTYDDQNRITTFKSTHDNTNSHKMKYIYPPDASKALIIEEDKSTYGNDYKSIYEYEVEFWGE